MWVEFQLSSKADMSDAIGEVPWSSLCGVSPSPNARYAPWVRIHPLRTRGQWKADHSTNVISSDPAAWLANVLPTSPERQTAA